MSIRFTSELSADHAEELEGLLFFNENQSDYREVIIDSIERFGEPGIRTERGSLRLHTRLLGEVQALFAVEEGIERRRPIAVAVYARTSQETMTLLHIAVREEFSASGAFADRLVTLRLIREVVKAVSRIKGVQTMEMLYGTAGEAGTAISIRPRRPGNRPEASADRGQGP